VRVELGSDTGHLIARFGPRIKREVGEVRHADQPASGASDAKGNYRAAAERLRDVPVPGQTLVTPLTDIRRFLGEVEQEGLLPP